MARRKKVAPRKRPVSRSGQAIHEAILDAAGQILDEVGLEGFTTNRVAERAGVSIGSLYQYFPNKDAVLAETMRRLERHTQHAIAGALEAHREAPLREAAEAIVDVLLGEALGSRRARRELRTVAPPEWTMATSSEVDTAVRQALAQELARRDDVRSGPVELLTFVIAHAVEQVVECAVLADPAMLGEAGFRDELVELIVRYLRA